MAKGTATRDIAFDVACNYSELIEPIVLSDREFKRQMVDHDFFGKFWGGTNDIYREHD